VSPIERHAVGQRLTEHSESAAGDEPAALRNSCGRF
jgi:hypothetical protein